MSALYNNKNIVGLIHFIIILDNEGKRLYSKFYFPPEHDLFNVQNQKELEKKIAITVNNYNVSKSNELDIFNYSDYIVLSRVNKELAIFIGANQEDNEIILSNFFEVFEESIENITNKRMTRKSILDNYQKIALTIDEMINEGIILNTDGNSIEDKVFMNQESEVGAGGYFSSLVKFARNNISNAIRNNNS